MKSYRTWIFKSFWSSVFVSLALGGAWLLISPSSPFKERTDVKQWSQREIVVSPTSPQSKEMLPRPDGFVNETVAVRVFPEVEAFARWTEKYLNSKNGRAKEKLEAEGIALAKVRFPVMKNLIENDPGQALLLAVTPKIRAALPETVLQHLEEEIAGEGFYGVLAVCDHGNAKEEDHSLTSSHIEREVRIGDAQYVAHVYGSGVKKVTTENASIYGVAIGKHLALHEKQVVLVAAKDMPGLSAQTGGVAGVYKGGWYWFENSSQLAAFEEGLKPKAESLTTAAAGPTFDPTTPPSGTAPPTVPYNEYAGSFSHQYGPKTVMVFLIQTSDGGTYTNPPSFSTLDSQLNDSSQWYYDASFRQTWFGPKYKNPGTASEILIPRLVVTPMLQLPQTSAFYYSNFGQLQSDCLAAARALGGSYATGQVNDYANFDRWVPMCNVKLIGSTGLAYVGGKFGWIGNGLNGNVALHEWGHNWGVVHANFWDPSSTGIARATANSHSEYGDGADIMGGGGGYFNPLFKSELGFIREDRGEIVRAQTSATYRLFNHLDPYSKVPESLVRGLIVPITGYGTFDKRLLVGFRRDSGSDQATTRSGWNRNGVEIHSDNTSPNAGNNDGSHFLDTTPSSRTTDDRDDGAVFIGRTYSEPSALNGTQLFGGLHITPIARGSISDSGGRTHEYIDVRVNYGNDISTTNAPPAASFSMATSTPNPGQAVTITATITDPDGDATASYWTFGDGTRSLDAQPSQTKSWATSGIYEVALQVSDMKGHVTPVSRFVNVGNLPYRDPENPSSSLPGLNYRYFSGNFSNVPDVSNLFPIKDGTIANFDISPRESSANFVFEYTGYIQIPFDDVYVFSTRSEDGSKLYIGDTLVVNNDGDRSVSAEVSGNIPLKAGLHAIRLVMSHKSGTPDLLVSWRSPSVNGGLKQSIPASALRQVDWSGNSAPMINITQPASGAEYPAFSSIQFQASASDASGIAKVQYFVGSNYIGQSTVAPYTFKWDRVSVGNYQITAIAYDASGRWTKSSVFTVNVVQPPPRNLVGIKFLGDQNSLYALTPSDVAGAYYQASFWNTGTDNSNSLNNLMDQAGAATSIRSTWDAGNSFTNIGVSTDGQGRMMRTGIFKNGTANLGFSQIPYLEYDVYVYADAPDNSDNDILTRSYTIGSTTKYMQGSMTKNDGIGDYPAYDTWTGFREATATGVTDPIASRLGNYTVFHGLSGSSFSLLASGVVNAVQIVESPSGVPRVLISESGFTTSVKEDGVTDSYTAVLSVAPSSNVLVTVSAGSQVKLDRTTLTFTPSNWNIPQSVSVSAVNDALAQGNRSVSITHTVSGNGVYASVTGPAVSVAIIDDDTASVTVHPVGAPLESATPTAAAFRFVRSGASSFASPLTVGFQMTGTASLSADYVFSGSSVSYNPGTGAGTVIIPAGNAQTFLGLTPTNDAVAEGGAGETAIINLQTGAGYAAGDPSSASLTIKDDDSVDYFTQYFTSGQPEATFDLTNRKLTFIPNGSPSYYAAGLETISAYPTSTTGHANLSSTALTSGSLDDGYWTYTLATSFNFYGTEYNTIYVSTNGGIAFASTNAGTAGLNLTDGSYTNHFAQRRIAAFWRDLSMAAGNGGGTLYAGRVSTAGQQRTVFTWNAVKGYNESNTNSFQIELWDSGKITLSWLNCASGSPMVGLSSQNSSTLPADFVTSNLSGYSSAAATNQAPVFSSIPPFVGTAGMAYSYSIVASDPENNPLTLIAIQKPAWLNLTDNGNGTATLAGTPPSSGTYDVALQVSDGTATAAQSFTLIAVASGGNNAPSFTSTPSTQPGSAGVAYSYTITTADLDGHRRGITAPGKPGWLTLTDNGNGTAVLSGTPPLSSAGITHSITLQVSDGLVSTTQSFGLFVQAGPRITMLSPALSRVYLPNSSFNLALEASVTDDGFPLSSTVVNLWSVLSGPSGATFDSQFSTSTVVHFTQNGSYVLRLSASDGAVTTHSDISVDIGGTGYGPTGLSAEYFQNTSVLGTPNVIRTDARIDSSALAPFPPAGITNTNFSVRWSGTVTPQYTESYSFIPATDDGVRVRVNGVLVVDDWRNKGSTDSATTPILLTAGIPVPIVMEYYQGTGGYSAKLDWSSASQSRQVIPSTAFNTYAPQSNMAPETNAIGVSEESVPPATAVTLSGTVTDDGNPNPPGELSIFWTKVSGPGNVTFVNANAATTLANFSNAGIYIMRLTADDGELRTSDDVMVTVVEEPGITYTVSGLISGTSDVVNVTDGYRTTSSSGGSTNTYMLPGVPVGTWVLRAYSTGSSFSPNGFANPVVVTANVSGRNFMRDSVLKYSISGLVTNLGNPLAGANVTAGGVSGTTDSRGGYYLSGFSSGLYTLTPNSGSFDFSPASRQVSITSGSLSGQDFVTTVVDTPPSVSVAASATPSPVTGTTANLSVQAADQNGEPLLNYQWSTVGVPPAPVSFSVQGSNAAKNSVATFTKSGAYSLRVTITDTSGGSVTSDVSIMVQQTATSVTLTPVNPSVGINTTQQFTASANDQFGLVMTSQPSFTWNISGGGTINSAGLFTAGNSAGGPFTVTASSGDISGTATVAVSTQTVLNPTADALIRNGNVSGTDYQTQNYGSDPFLRVKYDAVGYERQSYLKFDTSLVIGVTGAKVRLFMPNSQADTSTVNASIYAVSGTTWVEGTGTVSAPAATGLTWSTKPALGTKLMTKTVVNDSNSWYEWDVTAYLLAEKAAGRHIVCFAVINDTVTAAGQTFNFNARESSTNKPQLALDVLPPNAAPTIASAASADSNPVVAMSTILRVLGADDSGEGSLIYTWTTAGTPPAPVVFSVNGTNSAKSTTATFTRAGAYNFVVSIRDAGNLSITTTLALTVNATLSDLVISPATSSIAQGETQQFAVSGLDQFGAVIVPSPSVVWNVSGGGTINSNGLFSAAVAGGPFSITATSSAITESASISVTASSLNYNTWIQSYPLLTGNDALAKADPDGDGIQNLLEYALKLDPTVASRNGYPSVSIVESGGGGNSYLTITYRQRTGGSGTVGVDYSASGVVYRVEVSDSLAALSWDSGSTLVESVGSPVGHGDGTETVTVRRKTPIGGSATKSFIRLRVMTVD